MNRVQKIGLVLGVLWGFSVYSAFERERSARTYEIWAYNCERTHCFATAGYFYECAACQYRVRGNVDLAVRMTRQAEEMSRRQYEQEESRYRAVPVRSSIRSRIIAGHERPVQAPVPVVQEFRALPEVSEQRWVFHAAPGQRMSVVESSRRSVVPTRPAPRRPVQEESTGHVVINPLLAASFVPLRTSRVDIPVRRDEEAEPEESMEASLRRDEDPEPGVEIIQAWLLDEIVAHESPAADPALDLEMLARARGFFEEE